MKTINEIEFWIPGKPATAGSKKAFGTKSGKAIIVDDAEKRSRPWRALAVDRASQLMGQSPLMLGPLAITVVFRLERPKDHYGTGRNENLVKDNAPHWHSTRPDLLKMTRLLEDSLTGIVWKDDAQIAVENLRKEYTAGAPGTKVLVQPAPKW